MTSLKSNLPLFQQILPSQDFHEERPAGRAGIPFFVVKYHVYRIQFDDYLVARIDILYYCCSTRQLPGKSLTEVGIFTVFDMWLPPNILHEGFVKAIKDFYGQLEKATLYTNIRGFKVN